MPASEEVLLILSRMCRLVASLSTLFVLFQTVPVLVTGGGWEEEVVRRIITYKTIRFIASVGVYLCSTELHPAAASPFSPHPQCSNGLFCLNADYCLCLHSIRSSAERSHSTSTQWLKFAVGAMLSSGNKLVLLAMKVSGKLSDVLVWLTAVFAFRIVLLRRSSV